MMISVEKNAIEPRVRELSIKIRRKESLAVISRRFLQLSSDLPEVMCTPLLQGPRRVKAGFELLYDGTRRTLITHGRTIRYVYTRSPFLSLFLIRSLFIPHPEHSEKLPGSLLLARRFARARMNGDLSQRWERVPRPAGPSFSRQDARSKGRNGEEGYFSSKINTYSCDFITDGVRTRLCVRTFVTARRAAGREVVMSRRGKQLGREERRRRSLFAVAGSRFQKRGKERKRASARATRPVSSRSTASPRSACTCGLLRISPIPFSPPRTNKRKNRVAGAAYSRERIDETCVFSRTKYFLYRKHLTLIRDQFTGI